MSHQLMYEHLVIASHNCGKISELYNLMKPYSKDITSSKSLGLTEPEESGNSFIENAEQKATSAANISRCAALADDSGLCIDALNGQPGLYTARWARQAGGYNQAIDHVLERLESVNNRRASMVCALSLAFPDGPVYSFLGEVWGTISWRAKGKNNIGFEPIFIPSGGTKTLAEYALSQRDMLIPRAKAFHLLTKQLFKTPPVAISQTQSLGGNYAVL
ncbi:non-canonical purine NTP pyrophosphatase [Pseudoalteromonas luteoviolacea]|uniref:non-canonical purine NTP pyrophosphatase n=1 Tax=Pseudoalteromonas luteoviolacea TaxID=43657 RepID=UPI00114F8822|nr:non-canonical purine NTP pyrophosphatase [Pseudoalteromonas luteoviolacea]TQF70695.1 non-canonical purine NTP pyrophosphatase [Pseudoalteromonas luteoviolacea]